MILRVLIASMLCLPIHVGPALGGVSIGDLLIADTGAGALLKREAGSHTASVLASGGFLVRPFAVTVAPSGDIYVSDAGPVGAIIRISPTDGSQELVSSGGALVSPVALAVSLAGVIYVADPFAGGSGAIIAIDPTNGSQSIIASGGQPFGIALDASGNLIIARFNRLDRLTPAGVLIWNSFDRDFRPTAVCVNAAGDIFSWVLYYTGGGAIFKFNSLNGNAVFYMSDPYGSGYGIVADPLGILYLTGDAPSVYAITPDLERQFIVYDAHLIDVKGLALAGIRSGVVPARATSWGSIKALYHQ
jgi:DNA-binding beta-propeller fold protein YncE